MPFKFNVFTGNLDLVGGTSSGSGNVTGIPPTTPTAIARWVDTGGTTIENSLALVQDGGVVQAQGFVFDRQIINDIVVPDHYSMVNSDVELISGDIYLEGDAQLILL